MQVWFAVLDDLFRFALRRLFGVVPMNKQPALEMLPKPLQPLLPLSSSEAKVKNERIASPQGSNFISAANTTAHVDPVLGFDSVIKTLEYGEQVSVLKYGGRWAMVQSGDVVGWILKDAISNAAVDVYPQFSIGEAYDAEHATTKRLRLLISDSFFCAAAGLPLTAAEYVTYRLLRDQRQILWPDTRPRLPGRWQTILRGASGVHIGVVPKTGSIMEWTTEDDIGNVAVVEAVFPDESIQISAVDYESQAVYSESVLPKEVWLELRPVFIDVH